jgi:serine protease Do
MHPVASAPPAPFGRAQAQPRTRARSLMAAILVGASFATAALPAPAFA